MKQLLMLSIMVLFLLLVAGWEQQATAGPPPPVDHYKCYKVKGKAFDPKPTPTVVDQFEEDVDTVGKPFMLCNPANKNGEGFAEPDIHQVCYKVKGQKKLAAGLTLDVDNQFGANQIVKTGKKEEILCVPSLKECINDVGVAIPCPNAP